jgi:hypothetical protein
VVVAVTSVASGCGDDDGLSIDEAAVVDGSSSAASSGLFGTADVSFNGATSSVSGVTCSMEGGVAVSPIVADTFTLTIGGAAGAWDVRVTEPGAPEVVWTAVEPTVDVDGDALAGSAQMRRADDATVTAALAFVVDC